MSIGGRSAVGTPVRRRRETSGGGAGLEYPTRVNGFLVGRWENEAADFDLEDLSTATINMNFGVQGSAALPAIVMVLVTRQDSTTPGAPDLSHADVPAFDLIGSVSGAGTGTHRGRLCVYQTTGLDGPVGGASALHITPDGGSTWGHACITYLSSFPDLPTYPDVVAAEITVADATFAQAAPAVSTVDFTSTSLNNLRLGFIATLSSAVAISNPTLGGGPVTNTAGGSNAGLSAFYAAADRNETTASDPTSIDNSYSASYTNTGNRVRTFSAAIEVGTWRGSRS